MVCEQSFCWLVTIYQYFLLNMSDGHDEWTKTYSTLYIPGKLLQICHCLREDLQKVSAVFAIWIAKKLRLAFET